MLEGSPHGGRRSKGVTWDPHPLSDPFTLLAAAGDLQAAFPRQWLQWSPLADNVASANRRGTPHGFFVVWCGRQRGVFTRWCDAKASVAGHPGAKFLGFDDHSLATLALAAGPP